MKRSFLFFITCLPVFGCDKMDIPSTEPAFPEESRLEHVISIAEAVRSELVSTKGGPVLVDRDKIYYITAPSTKASAMDADTLMYILNYEADAGFAVIPYMDSIADYVCVTQNGFYDGSETGIWGFDEYMRQITAQISAYDPSLIDRSMKDEENVMTKAASTTTKEVEPIIPVEWHQDAPFNWYCSEPYNSLVPAGCVAVSIAQAMTVFKYPQNIQLTYPGARQNSFTRFPDLILMDGGKGQVHAAVDELEALGLDCIPVVGLAEKNEEIVFPDDRPNLVLDKANPALRILIALRDECHRFATSANQRMRSRDAGFALLQSIDGVGRKRAERIMKECSSIEGVLELTAQELAKKVSIPVSVAERVIKQLSF